jgi:hypothetical protein
MGEAANEFLPEVEPEEIEENIFREMAAECEEFEGES